MFNDKSKTIVERIAKQDAKINELVDEMNKSVEIVNGYTTDEETRVANEQVRIEYYNQRKEEINSINEQLDNNFRELNDKKANKKDVDSKIWTMANMGQDVKEAMTGGSVAVVGKNAILTENVVDKQIRPEKTNFINNTIVFELERGSINNGVDNNASVNNRLRCRGFIENENKMYILRKNSNFLIGVSTYNGNLYDGVNLGWIDQDMIEIEEGKRLRFNVKKRDNTDITDEEIEIAKNGIEVRYEFLVASNSEVSKLTEVVEKTSNKMTINKVTPERKEYEVGGISSGNANGYKSRIRSSNFIEVDVGDILKFNLDRTMFNYGVNLYNENKNWNGIDYGWMNYPEFEIEQKGYLKVVLCYKDGRDITDINTDEIANNPISILTDLKTIVSNDLAKNDLAKNTAMSSINIEYGRIKNASYVFVRIPKVTNDGSMIVPKVVLTSDDGSISGNKYSALDYSRKHNSIFTINAGLFNMETLEPVGQLIIDGVSLINTPMVDDNGTPISDTECYPLAIDRDWNLTTYPRNVDTSEMLNVGVRYCVTAWGKLVDNFKICTDDINAEIVHNRKYIRQSIGQFQNGDYCVCTVDMTRGKVENESGLYYQDLAQIFIDKGVKFAYSLDGGGSAETVIGKRQLNPIYEGSTGRRVPTVIEFVIE